MDLLIKGYIASKNKAIKIFKAVERHITKYPVPFNITYLWNFGSAASTLLLGQFVTGFLASAHHISNEASFETLEEAIREIKNEEYFRALHANGASFLFIILYLHLGRSIYYALYASGSYMVWFTGIVMFLLLIIIAFLGYVLPWGQMSYWAGT